MVDDGETRNDANEGKTAHKENEAGGGVYVGQAQSARKERAERCGLKKKSYSVTALQFAGPQKGYTSSLA